jgi:dimethylhistidine N-methyltransferase
VIRHQGHPISRTELESDVCAGLSKSGQKELYSKYFYDDLGTALFEAITLLPEYGLTRADMRLLRSHARDLAERAGNTSVIAELGSGSGEKAREILPAFVQKRSITYCPIDLSLAALNRSQRDLDDLHNLKIVAIEDSYLNGLAAVSKMRQTANSVLVLFLGSSIGNFEPEVAEAFMRQVRENLHVRDTFLLSTDLVKPPAQMLPAYNDALGLTAAFNLNLLARINRELGADFTLENFRHEARYNEAEQRIEMHLRSVVDQTVHIKNFSVSLNRNETIWTESSYKFRPEQVRAISERAGFRCEAQWLDSTWPFAQTLLSAI